MNTNRNTYLIKNIIVFSLTIIATKLITFLLVPVYTRYLNPTEFGITDLLFSLGGVIIPLVTFNISEAIYRFSMDKGNKTNKITSIIIVVLIAALIESLMIIPIMSIFPNYSKYKLYYYFYIVSSAISQSFSSNLKGQEKLKKLSICNTLFTFLVAIFNICFLIIFKMKIEGYFIAFIVANIIVAIYAFIEGDIYTDLKKFNFDKKLFLEMIKYSIILVPTSFMWWVINSSDRIMISHLLSDSANGIYAVSYKIPSFFITILSIFNSAWVFSAIKGKNEKDNEKYSNIIFSKFYFVIIFFSVCILTIIRPFLQIYVSNNYFVAWRFVPPLLVGGIFLTLSNYLATFYTANKDSKGLLYSTTIGAIINLILNYILICKIGIMGAAIATCVSYIVVFTYRFLNVKKYIKFYVQPHYFLHLLFLSVNIFLVYVGGITSTIIQFFLLCLYIIIWKNEFISLTTVIYNTCKNKFRKRN